MALYPRGKNDIYHVTGIASVPAATTYAGTLATDATDATIIHGTGTDFSFITDNDWWILDATHGEIRQITVNYAIPESGTGIQQLKIASAFTNPLVAADCLLVPTKTIAERDIENVGGGDGKLNGAVFPGGESSSLQNEYGLEPAVVDATGTDFLIQILYS